MGKISEADVENRTTNKPRESAPNSLQSSMRATEQQIIARLTALTLLYGRAGMTDGEYRLWLKTFCEDLAHLSDAQISYGCARYRRDANNKFLPTPGQLLAACRNQFDSPPGKTYAPLPDLPPPMPADRAEELIRETYRKLQYFPAGEKTTLAHNEEILARPLPVVIPMTEERKAELLANLKRRLATVGHNG